MENLGCFETDKEESTLSQAAIFAAKLANAVRAKGLTERPINHAKWTAEFKRLQENREDPEIKEILDWYCTIIGQDGIPRAFSAKSFRMRFNELRTKKKSDLLTIQVSPLAQEITNKLQELTWRHGSAKSLPALVQKSLDNYVVFRTKMRTLELYLEVSADTKSRRVYRFLIYYKGRYINDPKPFILAWFRSVNRITSNWENWSGDLTRYLFSEDSHEFKVKGWDIAIDYCCDCTRFDQLMEALNGLSKDERGVVEKL